MDPPTLWNAVIFFFFFSFFFCDRSTDQYGKPRGTSPCLSALGETRGFEAGICLLCRIRRKQTNGETCWLSRASSAPQTLRWRCLLVLWTGCQFLFLRGNRQSGCSPPQLSICPCTISLPPISTQLLLFCPFHPPLTFVLFIFLLAINVLRVPIFDGKTLRVQLVSLISSD